MWWLLACQGPHDPVALSRGEEPVHPCLLQGVCLPDPEGDALRNGWATVALDEQGRASLLFAAVEGASVAGLFIARSEGEGEALQAPLTVPIPVAPNVGSTEKPQIALHGEEVAIAFTGAGTARHGDAHALWLLRGTRRDRDIEWRDPEIIDELTGLDLVVEHARVAFAPDGELWLMWKRQRYGELDLAFWARERDGFVPERVSESLSTEHDCSPPDFQITPTGRVLLGLRSNVDGWLDTFAVSRDLLGQSPAIAKVSSDDWRYRADICPEDGPRVAALADGTLYVAWLAPGEFSWSLQRAWSTDGGQTFSPPISESGEEALGARDVAMVATDDGFLTALEGIDGRTRSLRRAHPDDEPESTELIGADGAPLTEVDLASALGRTVAVGRASDGTLWLLDLDAHRR